MDGVLEVLSKPPEERSDEDIGEQMGRGGRGRKWREGEGKGEGRAMGEVNWEGGENKREGHGESNNVDRSTISSCSSDILPFLALQRESWTYYSTFQ